MIRIYPYGKRVPTWLITTDTPQHARFGCLLTFAWRYKGMKHLRGFASLWGLIFVDVNAKNVRIENIFFHVGKL